MDQRIPKQIFQTWKTKLLSPQMQRAVNTVRSMNPEYLYVLFDDDECRQYLLKYFPAEVVEAFDTIIPGAFKADLWRYAVLYREGGVYMDIDFVEQLPLRDLIQPQDVLVSVKDRFKGVFQAFIAVVPGHPVLKMALDICVANVKNKYLGVNSLDRTGPLVFHRAINRFLKREDLEDIYPGMNGMEIRLLRINGWHDPSDVVDPYTQRVFFKTKYDGYIDDVRQNNIVIYGDRRWLTSQSDDDVNVTTVVPTMFIIGCVVLFLCFATMKMVSHNK